MSRIAKPRVLSTPKTVPTKPSPAKLNTVKGLEDVRGLAGTFTGAKGAPVRSFSLTLPKGASEPLRTDGGVSVVNGVKGTFSALANNPAVGAVIMFYGKGGPLDPTGGYFVISSQVDRTGKIHALTLGSVETGAQFTLTRAATKAR